MIKKLFFLYKFTHIKLWNAEYMSQRNFKKEMLFDEVSIFFKIQLQRMTFHLTKMKIIIDKTKFSHKNML